MSGSFAPPSSGGSVDLTSPGVIGGTTPNVVNATNLVHSGTLIQTPTSSQTLIASTTINPNAGTVLITAASAITMTSNPQITAGSNGQVIDLVNVGSNTITFTTNGIIWGQSSYPLYPGKIVRLKYLSTYSSWCLTDNTPQDLNLPGAPTTATATAGTATTQLATTQFVINSRFTSTFTNVSRSTNQTLTGQTFAPLSPDTVNSDVGSNWNNTTKKYTVPSSGVYIAILAIRPSDGASLQSFGFGVHTSAADGSWFLWDATKSGLSPTNRNGAQNIRVASFTAGDQLLPYAYMDVSGSVIIAAQELIIFRLF